MLIRLICVVPKLNVGPILFALSGNIETLAVIDADDPIVIAASLLQAPALGRAAPPTLLDDVRTVVVPATADNGERPAALAADDGCFVVAEVYDIPLLIGLFGIAPLLDVGAVPVAAFGHVQGFVAVAVHYWTGVSHSSVRAGIGNASVTVPAIVVSVVIIAVVIIAIVVVSIGVISVISIVVISATDGSPITSHFVAYRGHTASIASAVIDDCLVGEFSRPPAVVAAVVIQLIVVARIAGIG